jgi:hypothetical protein
MRHLRTVSATVVLALAGCQTAPNTQGAGYGDSYTPVIDMDGVRMERYYSDLDACRSNARKIDSGAATFGGMLAGMLVGAAIGASFGGNSGFATDGAVFGGGAGMAASGGKAALKQETIMANCMAGRGYRVLAGATVATNQYATSPYGPAPASTQEANTTAATTLTAQPNSFSKDLPQRKIGRSSHTVEALARQEACSQTPIAYVAASGPGFETYSVSCANGDTSMYRCEFGNCRLLK